MRPSPLRDQKPTLHLITTKLHTSCGAPHAHGLSDGCDTLIDNRSLLTDGECRLHGYMDLRSRPERKRKGVGKYASLELCVK